MVDASERLQVLLSQEATIYRTADYLSRLQKDLHFDVGVPSSDEADDAGSSPESPSKKRKSLDSSTDQREESPYRGHSEHSAHSRMNEHWRDKICVWAYQGRL